MNVNYRGKVRDVLVFPDPLLKRPCDPVTEITDRQIEIVDDLIETMLALPGCVGLSAPQIGKLTRIVVVDVSRHPKAPKKNHGLLCMLNPTVLLTGGTHVGREGCASLPEITANVERAQNVAVSYLNFEGDEKIIEASGVEAIAIQHEIDHLDGCLFVDRVTAENIFLRCA